MYADALVDRVETRLAADHRALVEAVRNGTIFAHDAKAYREWRQRSSPERSRTLVGAALESAVMNIARLFPDNVLRGTV